MAVGTRAVGGSCSKKYLNVKLRREKMTLNEMKKIYSADVYEHMLDVLFDTPVHDLVDQLLALTPKEDLDTWAKEIAEEQEEFADE
jgi:uncharacterized membrane protein YgaE (UPF0421/DUF939 family)